jgi:hypothetical protein
MNTTRAGSMAERRRLLERLAHVTGAMQLEFAKRCHTELVDRQLDEAMAVKVSCAISNHVFGFGFVSPEHAAEPGLITLAQTVRPSVLRSFDEDFKLRVTAALIGQGSAGSLQLELLEAHLATLATEGFAKVSAEHLAAMRDKPLDLSRAYFEALAAMGRGS